MTVDLRRWTVLPQNKKMHLNLDLGISQYALKCPWTLWSWKHDTRPFVLVGKAYNCTKEYFLFTKWDVSFKIKSLIKLKIWKTEHLRVVVLKQEV